MNTIAVAPNKIEEVAIKLIHDATADLSHLDQFKDATDPEEQKFYKQDQRRKADFYNDKWTMVGLKVTATISIPMGDHSTLQTIHSGGLWGIESDSKIEHFRSTATDEAADLKTMLTALNVDTSNFDELFVEANANLSKYNIKF